MNSSGNDGDETLCERTAKTDRSQMQCENNTTNGKLSSVSLAKVHEKKARTDKLAESDTLREIESSIDSKFNCVHDTVPTVCQMHQIHRDNAECTATSQDTLELTEDCLVQEIQSKFPTNFNNESETESSEQAEFKAKAKCKQSPEQCYLTHPNLIEKLVMSLLSNASSVTSSITTKADFMALICQEYPSPRKTHTFLDNLYAISLIAETLSRNSKESVSPNPYETKREVTVLDFEIAMQFHCLWLKFRQNIRAIFDAALETPHPADVSEQRVGSDLSKAWLVRNFVLLLCKIDSHQFFMRLVNQAQEFVVEVKLRLFRVLQKSDEGNLAKNFLTGLLNDYDALISTGAQISKLVKPLKKKLCKSNFTWDCFARKLYQIYVYNDPLLQSKLPSFILQLRNFLPPKGPEYQALVRRYLAFDDEMIKIGFLWPDTKSWIIKYNATEADRMAKFENILYAFDTFKRLRLMTDTRSTTKSNESTKASDESDEQLRSAQNSITTAQSIKYGSKKYLEALQMTFQNSETIQLLYEGSTKANSQSREHSEGNCLESNTDMSKTCDCQSGFDASSIASLTLDGGSILPFDCGNPFFPSLNNGFVDDTIVSSIESETRKILEQQGKDALSFDTEVSPDTIVEDINLKIPESPPCACVYQHAREITERKKEILEYPPCPCLLNFEQQWIPCPCLLLNNPSAVDINPFLITREDISCRTRSGVSNSVTEISQESIVSDTPTPVIQSPTKVETNTQSAQTQTSRSITQSTNTASSCEGTTHQHVNFADGDCSDSTSSQDDSCSTSSSVQKDQSRHCDCCYCEVFGHGVPSLAPVSRNYTEMRERLRQLLTKKKARKYKTFSSPPKTETTTAPVKVKREAVQNSATTLPTVTNSTANVPQKGQRDEWDLDELLEFIEGNQPGKKENNKKAEKKARQKQRKLEEKLEINRQEAERLKLLELQKKTPEVTITVVDPQRPVSQKLLPQCNLPEVSILPTSPPISLTSVKPTNNKKSTNNCNGGISSNRSTIIPSSISGNSGNSIGSASIHHISSSTNTNNNKNSDNSNSSAKSKGTITNSNVKQKVLASNKNEKNSNNQLTGKVSGKVKEKVEAVSIKSNKIQTVLSDASIKMNQVAVVDKLLAENLGDKQLTKKERKKLRREMKKMEEAGVSELTKPKPVETPPQIVTIKRVMESNNAEPTVTITLKGQSPAEDKVLFTLVNGQTQEPPIQKIEPEQNTTSKKKKSKTNTTNPLQQGNKAQQITIAKQPQQSQQSTQNKLNSNKSLKPQINNEKCKCEKQVNEIKQQQNSTESKSKSKKDKKNIENKENVLQHENAINKNKNQQQKTSNKKQNKTSTPPATPSIQKQQQKQQQSSISSTNSGKKNKGTQQQEKNNQSPSQKNEKSMKNEANQKGQKKTNQVSIVSNSTGTSVPISQMLSYSTSAVPTVTTTKLRPTAQEPGTPTYSSERLTSSLSSQFKDIGTNSKINIENLKLPPGITITKVDAPTKPLPIKSAPMPKPVNPPKQTTIIAAPMSGVQSSYATPQAGGNVIVVDTGKLKQDLLPKSVDKEIPQEGNQLHTGSSGGNNSNSNSNNSGSGTATTGKKKKKKNKNSASPSNSTANGGSGSGQNSNKCGSDQMDESARILHNPGTNMVTIRNPAFGPMKVPPTQQAAIIKVSENGMVTIRSPALQHAINAGLTTPPKPDYIVRGELSSASSLSSLTSQPLTRSAEAINPTINLNSTSKVNSSGNTHTMTSSVNGKLSTKSNGIIASSLRDLPSRLQSSDCASLSGLANIDISKVTNGQVIPENGINLKGTSVTLTKVRTETSMEQVQSVKTTMKDTANATIATTPSSSSSSTTSGKSKKKKKRGNGTRQGGDDWNLVESVFTPKDIDLEDGEMDDAERELEAFKRFCLQSVPPPRKEKVNLNIKDIVLKKKSSSSSSSSSPPTATVIAAN